ncbi:hypothetical protein BDQ12DRAFT_640450 [Crucibulum laeve]|uniref:DUF6593 domain-containing protein n=1 Tax=Crucibulum laeve TaxID=68775 RepID=A0A5C3MI50_9AGAR|nr:hypothetical protein BDQ12DRAFT_640450 [Crucibulum laeve]
MPNFGMPYFLEDKTGKLTGSEFDDMHDRMHFVYRCTARDSTRTAYMIYNTTRGTEASFTKPIAALDFGPGNSLGSICFDPQVNIPMKKYLTKTSTLGSSKDRKFVASDGQEYRWRWRYKEDQEWTCTNGRDYLIAYYNLKPAGEPEYENSAGCMLTVEEPYGNLAGDMLASLMIMRHIAAYNI